MTVLLFIGIDFSYMTRRKEVYSCMSDDQASEQAKEPDGNASYISRT